MSFEYCFIYQITFKVFSNEIFLIDFFEWNSKFINLNKI